MKSIEILRDVDPKCVELEALGYTLVGESWGARLRLNHSDNLDIYLNAVDLALGHRIEFQELEIGFADALLELELINHPDYPYTPATFHAFPTIEIIRALWLPDHRNFGALHEGVLIGAVSTSRKLGIVELDFASLTREYRGKGIGKALAATAILAWYRFGIFEFATGGAAQNTASLRTVHSLGFSIEERWRSYQLLQ